MLKRLRAKKELQEAGRLLAEYWKVRGMPQYDGHWAEEYLVQGHKKEIAQDEFLVYSEKGKMLGIVSLITDVSGVAEIRDLIIDPPERQKGYGRKILESIVETAKSRGIRKLYALALPQVESLYSSVSFVREGMLKNHFAPGEDLVIMSRFF